jgi:hypothetical protein
MHEFAFVHMMIHAKILGIKIRKIVFSSFKNTKLNANKILTQYSILLNNTLRIDGLPLYF